MRNAYVIIKPNHKTTGLRKGALCASGYFTFGIITDL